MPQRGAGIPPVGIVFDYDLGNQIDDVLALALLHGLDGKGECRVVATTVNKPNLKSAALSDVLARFYAGAGEVNAAFNTGRTLRVGLATGSGHGEDTPMLPVLAKGSADGKPAYAHGIERIVNTAEPVDVLGNALSARQPANSILVLTGPATSLAEPGRHDFPAGRSSRNGRRRRRRRSSRASQVPDGF